MPGRLRARHPPRDRLLPSSIRGGILDPIGLSPLTYVATILTAVLLYAVIAFIPTRFLARRRIAPQLTYE
jgi:hypothetical protein